MPEPVVNEPKVVSQPKVWSDAPIIEEYESDSEDEHVSLPTKELETPSFAFINTLVLLGKKGKLLLSPQQVVIGDIKDITGTKSPNTMVDQDYPQRALQNKGIDYPQRALQNKGIVDSGCSRHMSGNKDYLAEYQDFNGGPVAFSRSKCYIAGKGTEDNIDAGNYEIEAESAQVYFVLPIWSFYTSTVKSSKTKNVGEEPNKNHDLKTDEKPVAKEDQVFLDELERLKRQEQDDNDAAEALRKEFAKDIKDLLLQAGAAKASSTNIVNTTSTLISTASPYSGLSFTDTDQDDSEIPALEDMYDHPTDDLPYGKKAIGTKWVYKNKKDERGVVVRNKARLVAQGHRQEEGIDYDEDFAPMARIEAIRIFLAIASYMGFIVYQMDVKSTFLYGKIDKEVYVSQTPGFVDPKYPKKVYKVVKSFHGLHQAPRAWYATLSTFLLKSGYRRGTIDKTLFIKKDKNDIIQDKYVVEILKKFDFASVKTASTPFETHKPLVKDEEASDVDVHLYRSMIGSLMYLIASRVDIMFAVCACSRFQVTPNTSYLNAVKRIFRYLKGKPKLGLWYRRVSSFDLEAYSDSDYAGANLDRKSTTGGCQFLDRRLISWQCKKQTIVANFYHRR
ncbi:putative ribonuclease H-like domain-containing protein [Tanacetum coccineum]|uniref:Ribonuclease H-like domain-containing protein n=1 Tax=Tanacetum coccineum TaxID=301880 RepID=A0ABQ5FVD7_9ASTR